MAAKVELVNVRKGKGVVHLTVRAESGRPVQTLCDRSFAPGEIAVTDTEATCQTCIRRSENPARISNALFGQDMGAKLLELSLAGAPKRPSDRRADELAAAAEPPRLTVVKSGPPPEEAAPSEEPGQRPAPAGLDLSKFTEVGRDLYRSPGGVTLRLVQRRGRQWEIADIDCDGATRIEQLDDGRIRIRVGDLRIEYSGATGRKLRLT